MPIKQFLMNLDFELLRLPSNAVPDDIGAMPSSSDGNLQQVAVMKGRITPGDSLEPDIRGVIKSQGIDLSTMWIGFFNMIADEVILTGDYIRDLNNTSRIYQVQFVDDFPGGVDSHHYECRLQTTENFRYERG